MDIERKKSREEEREFYKDFIYPPPGGAAPGRVKRPRRSGKAGASGNKKYIVAVLIIIMLTGILLFADFLSNGLAIGLFKKNSVDIALKASAYYAVETGSFTSMSEAKACAAETSAAGGAGFIYNDGVFHVLASAYTKQADAAAAAASYSAAGVFTVSIAQKSIAFSGSKSEKEAVQESFIQPLSVFSQASDMPGKVKSGSLSAAQAYIKLQTLETDTQTALNRISVTGASAEMPVIRIKAELTSIINILADLADLSADAAQLARDINYNAIKILCSYKDMIGEL